MVCCKDWFKYYMADNATVIGVQHHLLAQLFILSSDPSGQYGMAGEMDLRVSSSSHRHRDSTNGTTSEPNPGGSPQNMRNWSGKSMDTTKRIHGLHGHFSLLVEASPFSLIGSELTAGQLAPGSKTDETRTR